jgi:hypothetical protein
VTAIRAKTAGTVLSGVLLGLVNLAAAILVVLSWVLTPDGDWDRHGAEAIAAAAFLGAGLALAALVLTIVPVAVRWIGKKWYLLPLATFVVAVARFVFLDWFYPHL